MLILGIDPGTATTGYGLINYHNSKISVESFGLIETDKNLQTGKRLIEIEKQTSELIKKTNPEIVAIEKLFFATNAKTAMNVGQAIGVIIYAIAKSKTPFVEYAPGTIKKLIAGSGRADKKDIQRALRKLLGAKVRSRVKGKTHFDNSADGLAVAVCHALSINK